MLVDGRTLTPGSELACDICLVGAGPAGLAIARQLAATGLTTILLESGGFSSDARTQQLYRGRNVGRTYWRLDLPRVRYFGGSSNKWGGWCRPLDAIDFEQRAWVNDSGWPISQAALTPHYQQAQDFCQLRSAEYGADPWQSDGAALGLGECGFEAGVFHFSPPTLFGTVYRQEVTEHPRTTTVLNANVLELVPTESRESIAHLRVGTLARTEFQVKARAYVLAAGGIENPRLLLASDAKVSGGIGNGHDMVGRCFMEHPHVAVGHFLPTDPAFTGQFYVKRDLGGDLVKGVHLPLEATTRANQLLGISISLEPPGYSIGDFFNKWPRSLVLALTRMERLLQSYPRIFTAVRQAERFVRRMHVSDKHHEFSRALYQYLQQVRSGSPAPAPSPAQLPIYRIYCRSEQGPNRQSRVMLDRDRDSLGVRRALLDWRITTQDTSSIATACELFALAVGRAGVGRAWLPQGEEKDAWQKRIVGGPHHMGTTRMSSSPRDGVVDADCRVHGMHNLYVAGSSVFPTGGHANPTLTLIALAFRLADHLKLKYA
jgi:choline dehydrogenase-like flavoprotein